MLRRTLPVALVALAIPVSAASAGPVASAAKKCGDKQDIGGFNYAVSIKASGVSCGKANKVIKAYGNAGAGDRSAGGFNCTDKVLEKSPASYYAKATCKSGSKSVKFVYQQDT